MDDLSSLMEFLHACIDEDEMIARAAAPGPWDAAEVYSDVFYIEDAKGRSVANECGSGFLDPSNAVHIARWEPARALAEVGSKRHLISYCTTLISKFERSDVWGGWPDIHSKQTAEYLLSIIVQPYVDRPGYDPEWGDGT